MEFDTDKQDYSVPEFFERFSKSLPKYVMVTQGFFGEILEDTFDSGQVIRVHSVSRQKRVVSKNTEMSQMSARYYSLPLTYPIKLCVVKGNGKVGKERTLQDIVQNTSLPVDAQFAKNQTITVGNKEISTTHFPLLHLIETFDEIYLLGNFLIDGVLDLHVVGVPLYLSSLRLAEVIGFKGQTFDKWKRYTTQLDEQVEDVMNFDIEYGNKDIAVYHRDAVKPGSMYSYIEPKAYTNFSVIFQHHTARPDLLKQAGEGGAEGGHASPQGTPKQERKSQQKEENITLEAGTPPIKVKSQEQKVVAKQEPKPEPAEAAEAPAQTPAASSVPVSMKPLQDATSRVKVETSPQQRHVSKLVGAFEEQGQGHPANTDTKQPDISSKLPEATSKPADRTSDVPDIASLTIDGLAQWLKELKLDKYVSTFRDQLIDGPTLLEIDETIMKEDFQMSKIEVIRLKKFIKDGHVPR